MFILVRDRLQNRIVYRRLTRRRYYSEGKVDSSQVKSNRWNMNSKDLFEEKSINHFKTSNEDSFIKSIQFYRENYDSLWRTLAITRKRSRLSFRIHRFKRRSIDKFLQDLKPREGGIMFITVTSCSMAQVLLEVVDVENVVCH